jgi:hypothetical protein
MKRRVLRGDFVLFNSADFVTVYVVETTKVPF